MSAASFKSRQLSFILYNLVFTAVLFGVHQYILSYFFEDLPTFFPPWHIYAFLFVITTIFYTILNYRFSSGHKNVFTLFMVGTFIKMALAILFLLPLILSEFDNKQPDIFNFFIGYFAYLFLEVFALSNLLRQG